MTETVISVIVKVVEIISIKPKCGMYASDLIKAAFYLIILPTKLNLK